MISFLLVAILALGVAGEARSETWKVGDEGQFAAALNRAKGGDVIQLADGTYPALTVKDHSYSSAVQIVGSRDAVLNGIDFEKSSKLKLSGVTIAPQPGTAAKADATRSIGDPCGSTRF